MAASQSQRLGAEDALFLYFEKASTPLHVGSVGVYEGAIPYDALLRHLDSRMHTIPRYRQRVVFVPLDLGFPVWQDDPDFDLRRHVRRFRPRRRMDDEQLAAAASELFAPPLERDRPLWDITLIEGLSGGRSALLSRAHHCMVDGVSGLELLVALLDMSREPRPVEPPVQPWSPTPVPPAAEVVSDALCELAQRQVRFWTDVQLMLVDPQEPARRMTTITRSLQKAMRFLLTPAPATPLNASITAGRRLAWTEMPFADVRAIRGSLGGTVNDVVLTILAGALRRYIARHSPGGRLPPVRCLIPVNVRHEDEQGTLGNRVSLMLATLPLPVPDPLRRHAIVRRRLQGLKRANQAEGIDLLARLLGQLPPPVVKSVVSTVPSFPNTVGNLVCTNVPGPMVPLYCIGHRMLAHYPLAPIAWDMGVNVGVMSYDQRLFWGLVANDDIVRDPELLAVSIDEAFAELRQAAGVTASELPPMGAAARSRGLSMAAGDGVRARDGEGGAVPGIAAANTVEAAVSPGSRGSRRRRRT